ncbi:MAG: alpha/beta fold hydrolase [Acidobacteriota bacterium]
MRNQPSPLFQRWRPQNQARARLVCFSYAGGGTAVFRQWPAALAPEVEVVAVRAPGRENRMREQPHRRIEPLVDEVVTALRDLGDGPTALFGHSLGASVAFEVAHALTAQGRAPALVALSGRRPPHLPPDRPPVGHLDDAGLLDYLRSLGGTPEEVLEHPELVQMLLPVFRADMQMLESYVAPERRPLTCPVVVYGGIDDPLAGRDDLRQWGRHVESDLPLELFPGGHFFLDGDTADDLRRRVKLAVLDAVS